MTELPLVFLGGLLGSSHCVGMCGGFAIMVGMATRSCRQNLAAQLVYSAGRIATYTTIGGAAGFAGWRLVQKAPALTIIPAILSLVAGGLLIVEGLYATGLVRRRQPRSGGITGCLAGSMFGELLRMPGLGGAFSAGLVTGLLPCGLVYAFVALAASSHDLVKGMGTMAAFGLGTVPLMVAAGTGSMLLTVERRKWLYRAAAWCVIATGMLTIVRGYGFLAKSSAPPAERCPFCRGVESK